MYVNVDSYDVIYSKYLRLIGEDVQTEKSVNRAILHHISFVVPRSVSWGHFCAFYGYWHTIFCDRMPHRVKV